MKAEHGMKIPRKLNSKPRAFNYFKTLPQNLNTTSVLYALKIASETAKLGIKSEKNRSALCTAHRCLATALRTACGSTADKINPNRTHSTSG